MTETITALRVQADTAAVTGEWVNTAQGLLLVASDEIERLSAQLNIAMTALRRINAQADENIAVMRRALGETAR